MVDAFLDKPVDPASVAQRMAKLKTAPIVPESRRDIRDYAAIAGEVREGEVATMMGEIIYEAGQQVDRLVKRYTDEWRKSPADVIELMHDTAKLVLDKDDPQAGKSTEQGRDLADTFRAMKGDFQRRASEAGLMDAKDAGRMVADIVHNEFVRKETEISMQQTRRIGA